jgi:hypothetical protein
VKIYMGMHRLLTLRLPQQKWQMKATILSDHSLSLYL